MDETRDITTKQMLCLCLRYVEEDTGKICEQLFMLKPITDTTGEGKEVRQSELFHLFVFFPRCIQSCTTIYCKSRKRCR